MALLGAKIARSAPTVDLTQYAIDDASMQWLEDRLGSRMPKASAVDSLARAPLTAHEQRFMDELLKALRGGGRSVSVSVTQSGVGEAQRAGFMQATLRPKTREAEVVGNVRRAVEAALWGQERHLDAFCRVASDHVSETRTLAAVMAIGGDRGHGKTEALSALTNGLYAKVGKTKTVVSVHEVDLSTVTDASAAGLFEEDGPLSPKTLRQLVGRSIVCFQGANDLQVRAPQVAKALQSLLATSRHDANYQRLLYVFDFDHIEDGSVLATLAKAIGPVGTRALSAHAVFERLDAETMRRYCVERLPALLKSKALGDVRVDFDDAALAVIGQALATPFIPLEELDARIYQLVLAHLELFDGGGKRRPERVQMSVATDHEETERIITNLTSEIPDITLARNLLRVAQVIDSPDSTLAQDLECGEATAVESEAVREVAAHLDSDTSLDADAAIALLASIDPKEAPRKAEFETFGPEAGLGSHAPHVVVAALEAVARVRHATEVQRDTLRALADNILRESPSSVGEIYYDSVELYRATVRDSLGKLPLSMRDDEQRLEIRQATDTLRAELERIWSTKGALDPLMTVSAGWRGSVLGSLNAIVQGGALDQTPAHAAFGLMINDDITWVSTPTAIAFLAALAYPKSDYDNSIAQQLPIGDGVLATYPPGRHQLASIAALEVMRRITDATPAQFETMRQLVQHVILSAPAKCTHKYTFTFKAYYLDALAEIVKSKKPGTAPL